MYGNPVLHDWPARMMTVYEMHFELNRTRHYRCNANTCMMFRYCWTGLVGLGHDQLATCCDDCSTCQRGGMSVRHMFPDGTTLSPGPDKIFR